MAIVAGMFASLPSPSSGTLEIGPLKIHAYGLMIALGIVAAVWLMGRLFEEKGIGVHDDANGMALWAVLAGIIGARLYHVATDWSKFEHNLSAIPKIWQGGLGIPGGLAAGIPVGLYYLKRKDIPVGLAANCGAPAIALAQAIGRWGNYWNQELFGGRTTLPWGLEIDDKNIPIGYAAGTHFHPTFLYESLANLGLAGVLLLIDKRYRVRPGHLMAMYLMGYGAIRFFVEGLRIDEAHHIAGLRWNQWVALAAVVGAGAYLWISTRLGEPLDESFAVESGFDATARDMRDESTGHDIDDADDAEDIDDADDIDSDEIAADSDSDSDFTAENVEDDADSETRGPDESIAEGDTGDTDEVPANP